MTMKTRRKSKAANASTVEQEPDASSSQTVEEVASNKSLSLALPADLDIETLSNLLPGVPLTSPSAESIITLYNSLVSQASQLDAAQRELDDARADAERKDIELDQALQDKETTTKDLEAALEAAHAEATRTKHERDEIAASRSELEAQIASLSASKSSSSTELEDLKGRLSDAEREKRDLLGVISRVKQENSQREEEVQTLRANLKEARQDHQALEAQVRELRSTETSTKFKIDSLTQQLQLAQSETERNASELVSKSEEFAKYRRSKHAEFMQLQAAHDTLVQTSASTESSLKALQSAHTTQTHQYTQVLARVQDLTGQLAEQEAIYSSEASGLRRLVAMMEEREKEAKDIVEGIEREWAGIGDKAERREAALKEEIEVEKHAREQAEKKIEQLEAVLSRLDRNEEPFSAQVGSVPPDPATPIRTPSTPDLLTQGMMGLSPTIAMASKAQKAGKMFTEVYSDYVRLQEEFAKKSTECDHLDRTLSAVLAQIEERAPILSQQRAEYERLQAEAAQLASQLARTLADRDSQAHMLEESSQKYQKSLRENELLQRQLDDLGRQVQALLKEIGRRDDPTIPSDEDLDLLPPPPAENIEAVITNNLVLFRSIGGLQEQNQKLLKIVRELGARMEAEEKEYKEKMETEQGEAVREAHEAIQELVAQLERQKKSSEATIQAYMKERDALRSMLDRAERSGVSRGSLPNGEVNGIHEESSSNLAKELAEVQSQFAAYRTEMGVDSVRLREELVHTQREASQLGAALAKANAKVEYLNDRHRMLQEELSMQSRDIDNLRKRNQQLVDQFMRADIACNHATEDLMEAKSQVEHLRNECANLRAEKKIWESVQIRLADENKMLALERSHLSDLMTNVRKMHGDLEQSGENDRRRLESQVQMLEQQSQDLKTQLSQERDAVRHLSLQKEIELKEIQTRLDKASQDLAKARESLIAAETSKIHLEERANDLSKQLQGQHEKLAVYERRSSNTAVPQNTSVEMSNEQQLEAEVAELRSALKVAEMDLATARSHVQQFQDISQANESALASLNATYDEYKASIEAQLAQRESDYKALEERLHAVQEELVSLKARLSEQVHKVESERLTWLNEKKELEDIIVDMSNSEKHQETDRSMREATAREQEERAKAAEQRYANEVIAHAESMKAIENLKQQLSAARTAEREHLATAETAKANLSTSEASWKQQKESLAKEIADLNARCKDLASHNTVLHQHLEEVTSQAARIKQAAADSSTGSAPQEGDSDDTNSTKQFELRSVIAYLRKEKEIIDLQLELSKQENTRLKVQIEHLSQNLQESRTTLAEERQRAVEVVTSEAQHKELIEKINQLNILRESNATLRSECENYAKRARELETKLQSLSSELEPVKEQSRLTRAELEARDMQVKRLEEETRRWQERNTQLLTKFDRIDPAEVQALKDEIEQLKAGREQAAAEKAESVANQTQRIEALEANIRNHKEAQARNNQGFRLRLGQLNTEKSKLTQDLADSQAQIKNLIAERDALKAKIPDDSSQTAEQIEALRGEKVALEKALAEEKASKIREPDATQVALITSLQEERDKLLLEKQSWTSATGGSSDSSIEEAKRLWDSEKAELTKTSEEAKAQAKAATEQAKKALEEVKNIRFSNEKFQSKIQDLQRARAADAERAIAQQEASVKVAVDNLKSELNAMPNSEEIAKRHAEELRVLQEQLTAKHQQELKAAVEAASAAAAAASHPAGGLVSEEEQKAAIVAAIDEHEKKLSARHAEEIASAVERGRMEQATKGKLKDSQLVKSQKRVKELETQILEWRMAGFIPESSTTAPSTTTSSAATAAIPQAATSSVPVTPVASKPPPTATPGTLPRKPSMPAHAAGEASMRGGRGGARGLVRGQRGGLNIRGAAPGRGGAPAAPTAPAASNVSIMGAAAKRNREDGDTQDDSLAKRIKPAEGVTGGPVALRRPPPS